MNPDQIKTFIGTSGTTRSCRPSPNIYIPNKSTSFDPKWEENGYMEQAVTLMTDWTRSLFRNLAHARTKRTPVEALGPKQLHDLKMPC